LCPDAKSKNELLFVVNSTCSENQLRIHFELRHLRRTEDEILDHTGMYHNALPHVELPSNNRLTLWECLCLGKLHADRVLGNILFGSNSLEKAKEVENVGKLLKKALFWHGPYFSK